MDSGTNYSRYDTLAQVFMKVVNITQSQELKMLVVGAGDGHEVMAIKHYIKDIVGIEPNYDRVNSAARPFVRQADARKLPFPDNSFDLVYCYHVLEHIPDCKKALSEMYRVLKQHGILYLGVPNKSRLLGYICVNENSLKEKILWNLKDYKARITGKFENCFGAHAGFTVREMSQILKEFFKISDNVTHRYYLTKHGRNKLASKVSAIPFMRNLVWSSIYFVCTK